jgi:Asp-tRNA(Asn)/Glu-tRNA(Gln) amidotransferase C subunit
MHIDIKLDELRADAKIDSDISAILNKQVTAFDLYKLRNKHDKEIQKLTRLQLSKDHLDKVLRIDETATRYAQRYKKFLTNTRLPFVKAIKILKKERLAVKLYDLFLEALTVVNVN